MLADPPGGTAKRPPQSDPAVTTVYEVPKGIVRDPDVSFDGKQILFSMRLDAGDDYHLFEIKADGTHLKQLTFG